VNTRISSANTTTPQRNWLDHALFVATLLTCAVALSPNLADPDLWGHVRYGEDVFREGLPATTTYSFTAEGYPWINHENLAELTLAAGMNTIGPVGMLIAKCLLGVGVIGLIIRRARLHGAAMLSTCVVALLVSVNLTYFWSLRPQVFTCIYFALLLALLSWCFQGWEGRCWVSWFAAREPTGDTTKLQYSSRRLRFLWLAPVIFVFWANSHGGFVAGWCIYTAYLVFRSFEAWLCKGRAARGLIARFTMMILAAGLATLINPYGPGLHLWLLQSLGSPRPEIMEWRMPDMTSTIMLPLWLILFTWLALLLLSRRPRDVTHVAILTLTLWQALSHQRHIPFFAIPFGFWMAPHVDSVLRRFNIVNDYGTLDLRTQPVLKWSFGVCLTLAFALLGYKLYDRLHEVRVDRDQYPVAAFQYMANRDLEGKMVVTYNWAQYAIAAFGPLEKDDPGILVSFDGRFRTCYPQDIVDMNFDFVLGDLEPRFRGTDVFDDERVLDHGKPDLVLINRHQPHSVNVMFRNRDQWILLYQDKMAQLWGRSTRYGNPDRPDFIPHGLRSISEAKPEGSVPWPAMPIRHRSLYQLADGATR
jgi:hypothetical protein